MYGTDQVQHDAVDGICLGLLKPLFHCQEARPAGDVVHKYHAMGAAVEAG